MNIRILLGINLQADTIAVNCDGTRVWLKEVFGISGRQIGVVDCCPESAPCPWHAALGISTSIATRPVPTIRN
jgi:hypothetical protein